MSGGTANQLLLTISISPEDRQREGERDGGEIKKERRKNERRKKRDRRKDIQNKRESEIAWAK